MKRLGAWRWPTMMMGPLLSAAGCGRCQVEEADRQQIADDGTALVAIMTHCSALSNTVEFYLDRPGSGRTLFARGTDLEEFRERHDAARRRIVLATPDPDDITVVADQVASYPIRKAKLRSIAADR